VHSEGTLWSLSEYSRFPFPQCEHHTHHLPRCHLGRSIIYDTATELGWSAGIANHGIVKVIEDLLNNTWKPAEDAGREVPEAKPEDDCVVSGSSLRGIMSDNPQGMLPLGIYKYITPLSPSLEHWYIVTPSFSPLFSAASAHETYQYTRHDQRRCPHWSTGSAFTAIQQGL
jgi:hypothetical protein